MTQQRKLRDAENTWNHMLTGGNIKVTWPVALLNPDLV